MNSTPLKHPKNRKCEACGKPSARALCGFCLSNHAPIPEHHVAKERTCLRCGKGFESSWSGDRVCSDCRERQEKMARAGRWHESPFEPLETPGMV